MKHRILDVLQCSCGKSDFVLKNVVTKGVPFADSLSEVRCKTTCAFKGCSVADGGVRPSDCMECYSREIMEGTIHCVCGRVWQIVSGIPRFLPDALSQEMKKTQETFSNEWRMFRFGERNWGQDIEYRKILFLDALGASPDALKGKLIFDAGCGSGLLSMEMAKSFGMEVVALDLAFGIEQAYEHNDSPYVHFIQGSVLEPPLRKGVFDRAYCAGVLVACPDARGGFRAIVPTLKKGGRFFIWVYHPIGKQYYPREYRKLLAYNWVRRNVTSRLPTRVQYYLYLSWIPAFLVKQFIEKVLGRRPTQLTWREKMQNLFDFFSPIYQHRFEPPEIKKWFAEDGFINIEVANKGPQGFGVRGDRS